MAEDFPMQLKSTLDKVVADAAARLQEEFPTLRWAEVDDMAQTDEVFKSTEPALIWSFGVLKEHPRAPLYACDFMVGAKTVKDPGNYLLIRLLGEIREAFAPGQTYPVFDYTRPSSEPNDITRRGFITVSSNEIMEQGFDRQSGIRYALVQSRVAQYG